MGAQGPSFDPVFFFPKLRTKSKVKIKTAHMKIRKEEEKKRGHETGYLT
jgi:hypothetical protein